MRSNEELMKGILQRKAVYLERRQTRRLAITGVSLAALLTLALCAAPGVSGPIERQAVSAMGATILGPEAGGYVIVALLAFALGVVISLTVQKLREKENKSETGGKR